MKKEIYECDICSTTATNVNLDIQVIFETEQQEGRSTKSYFRDEILDLCNECKEKNLRGNYIFASGAMGYNKYYFKTDI
jgi:hypothetical protein